MKKALWIVTIVAGALGLVSATYAAVNMLHYRDGVVKRGQTMPEVKATFGEPVSVVGPVGAPQVTQWTLKSGEVVVFLEEYVHDAFVVTQ